MSREPRERSLDVTNTGCGYVGVKARSVGHSIKDRRVGAGRCSERAWFITGAVDWPPTEHPERWSQLIMGLHRDFWITYVKCSLGAV
jgi:hypothetical protein